MKLPTPERVSELLIYERENGSFRWRVKRGQRRAGAPAGGPTPQGYRRIAIDGPFIMVHRLVWFVETGVWPTCVIDHKNGDRADNRIENLRDVPHESNSQNSFRASANNTGLTGVYWRECRKKYRAKIIVAGKEIFLGYFDTAEKGHAAYITAKFKYHDVVIP